MAVSVALRNKGTASRATVDVSSWMDSATTWEFQVIVDGLNLRRLMGNAENIDLVLVDDGTETRTLRIAGSASNKNIQIRARRSGPSIESAQLTGLDASSFCDWRKYALVAGFNGSTSKWLHVAELLDDGTYDWAQDSVLGDMTTTGTPAGATVAMSGAEYIWAPAGTGEDSAFSLSNTEQGPFDFWLVAFRTGSDVLGPSATAAECFGFPTPTTANLYYRFDNGEDSTVSSTVTGYGTDAANLTLGGTHRTNWLSLGRNPRFASTVSGTPSGWYSAHGATLVDGRIVLHSETNNTADDNDPEFGALGVANAFDDVWQALVRVRTAPSSWWGSGNTFGGITFALRDDLDGAGGVSGTLSWLLQRQVGYDTSGTGQTQQYTQNEKNNGGITRSPAAPDRLAAPATEGDYIYSIEGDGVGGVVHRLAILNNGGSLPQQTWELQFSDASGWTEAGIGALDFRTQSKNRTGGTSTFGAGEYTAIDGIGSGLLVLDEPEPTSYDADLAEGGSAGDSWGVVHIVSRDLSEGASAGEGFDVEREVAWQDEGAKAGDSFSSQLVYVPPMDEGAKGGDSWTGIVVAHLTKTLGEGATAGDSWVGYILDGGILSEGAVAGDSWTASRPVANAPLNEGARAGDTWDALLLSRGSFREGALGGDSWNVTLVGGSVVNMLIDGITTDVTTSLYTAKKIVFDLQPNRFTLVGARNSSTGAYLTSGTAQLTVYDKDGSALSGVGWPVNLPYVSGSNGNFSGVAPTAVPWSPDTNYRGRISLSTAGEEGVFEFDIRCKRRGTT